MMFFSFLCTLVIFAPATVFPQFIRDPCGDWLAQGYRCYNGQECRLVQPNYCSQPPCIPMPRCVPKLPRVSDCRYGDPVLDMNNRPLTCYPGRNCPTTTTCNTLVMDTQATCCWTPQSAPSIQPPTRPTLQPFNPCISTLCMVGQVCEVQQPITCFSRPCQPIGVCVAPKPTPPTFPWPPIQPIQPVQPVVKPVSPCQLIRCTVGHHCEEVPTQCAAPGPCPMTGLCVKDQNVTTVGPNQCPVLTGRLNCDINCELDTDCDPGFKCCKHNCGAMCAKPGPAVVPTPTEPATRSTDPCASVTCTAGSECRLHEVMCVRAPCPPIARCGPILAKPQQPQCPVGLPVVDASNKELFCGRGPSSQVCPDETFCNVHPTDQFAVCCHDQRTVAQIATTTPAPVAPVDLCNGFFCPFGQECKVETIFCVTTPCPGPRPVCRLTNKAGSCPTVPPGQVGICVAKCSTDADCSGTFKCCGSCPRQCTAPAITNPGVPTIPINSPCSLMLCAPNMRCVEKTNPCFNPPCPTRGECVPNIPPPPTQPVQKPGVCRAPTGSFGPCANMCSGDQTCPGTQKCCRNGCGFSCQEPRTEKDGFCPPNQSNGNATICLVECNGDFSCPMDQKCCTQGCRTSCTSPVRTAPYVDSDPCKRQTCNPNQVCKLQQMYCIRPPCQPQPVCIAASSMDSTSTCKSGYPVLNWSQRPIACGQFSQRCPDNTVCKEGTCCWDTTVPVNPPPPAGCPGLHDTSLWYFCRFYPTCSTDANCSSGQKCCHASGCGNRCMTLRSK